MWPGYRISLNRAIKRRLRAARFHEASARRSRVIHDPLNVLFKGLLRSIRLESAF